MVPDTYLLMVPIPDPAPIDMANLLLFTVLQPEPATKALQNFDEFCPSTISDTIYQKRIKEGVTPTYYC